MSEYVCVFNVPLVLVMPASIFWCLCVIYTLIVCVSVCLCVLCTVTYNEVLCFALPCVVLYDFNF